MRKYVCYAWKMPLRGSHVGYTGPKMIIEKDVTLSAKKFEKGYAHYIKWLPANSFHKQFMVLPSCNVSDTQKTLIDGVIKAGVKVRYLDNITVEEKERLAIFELFDTTF